MILRINRVKKRVLYQYKMLRMSIWYWNREIKQKGILVHRTAGSPRLSLAVIKIKSQSVKQAWSPYIQRFEKIIVYCKCSD